MERTFSQKVIGFSWKALLAIVLLFVLYTWFVLKWSYATGERAGYVRDLQLKGWVCKTWEGELAMANVPGALTEPFLFTVREDSVAQQIKDLTGKAVALSYEQHVGIPSRCFGDTSYYVTGVREVTDGLPEASPPQETPPQEPPPAPPEVTQ